MKYGLNAKEKSRGWESLSVNFLTEISFRPALAVFAFRRKETHIGSNKNIAAGFDSCCKQSSLLAPQRKKPRMGVEPTTYGLQNRCSAN